MKKKRIFINLLNFTDDQIAGVGIFSRNLLGTWIRAKNDNFEITLCHVDNVDIVKVLELPAEATVRFKKVKARNFISRILYEQLVLPFRLKSFDCYFSPTPAVPLALRFVNKRIQIIVTIHDMIPFYVHNKYTYLRTVYIKMLSKFGARLADDVVTVSENSRTDIVKFAHISSEKIHIIYNFVPVICENNCDFDDHFFLTIATIEPGKNVENTLQGFKKFLAVPSYDHYRFVWIGKVGWGYSWTSINTLLSDEGLSRHVTFTGYISDEEKQEYIRRCSGMVCMSHYEGFGLPVLEGLAQNKPAIVSAVSSLPEVVGNAGITCDPNDPAEIAEGMFQLAANKEQFREAIREQLKKFDRDTQLKKFLELIES